MPTSKSQSTASKLTRRSFVAATAASALTFNYIPSSVFGANDRLNYAGIGVGGKGAGEVNDLSKAGCNVVALCDVDLKRAGGTLKKFPKAKVYRDFRQMLDKEANNIDMVSVSTPDHMHAHPSAWAMQLGKHCYTQKPMTHSVYEARVLTNLARQNKVATQMGNQAHAGEPIRRAVELIQAGALGAVREVHAWTNRPIWKQGMKEALPKQDIPASLDWDLWLGPAPARDYNQGYLPFSWRGWWDFGTGAMGDMACHIMDMPFWALDLAYPTSIEAEQGGNTKQSPPNWSTITWQFPQRKKRDNGVEQPAVKYVWYDGKKDGQPNGPKGDNIDDLITNKRGRQLRDWDLIVIGDKGRMLFQRKQNKTIITPDKQAKAFASTPQSITRVKSEDYEFVTACKGGQPAESNFDYAGLLTETVLLGNVAIQAGEKLEWDGPNMRVTNNVKGVEQLIKREYRQGWSLGKVKIS
jgi:predicted dehydrogenase